MNSCILMAQIVQEPELRYTPDNQTAIAQMLVQFPALRPEDPPATLKVVGWGNLAQEIQQNYHQGDRVIIEGRLSINTIPHSEGFKEKRAELTVQRIHPLGDGVSMGSSTSAPAASLSPASVATPSTATEFGTSSARTPEKVEYEPSNVGVLVDYDLHESVPPPPKPQTPTYQKPTSEPDVDDIPF